ncbi:MAG: hypothetical protein QM804_17515 [Propionicimonas sp.]
MHAQRSPGLHDRVELFDLAFADQVADRGGVDQHLGRRHPALQLGVGQQGLADHALQGVAELGADLVLLVGGEAVDDPVDRLGGALGMQGAQHQVAGLGGGERDRDRLRVPQLADQNDVRVLPQDAAQCLAERGGVRADLPLVDQRPAGVVQVLDRILDGDDVHRQRPVHDVDHGRQGGRLARTGRSGDQHEAAGLQRQLAHHRWHDEFLKGADRGRDQPERAGELAELAEDVHPETPGARYRVGQVDLVLGLEGLQLVRVHHATGGGFQPGPVESVRMPGNRQQITVHPHQRRCAFGQVNVGGASSSGGIQDQIQ